LAKGVVEFIRRPQEIHVQTEDSGVHMQP